MRAIKKEIEFKIVAILTKLKLQKLLYRFYWVNKLFYLPTLRNNLRYRGIKVIDGLCIPNFNLIFSVIGKPDIHLFLKNGKVAAESIIETLAKNGLKIENFGEILEFGCGCGRILRYWHNLNKVEIYGVDCNEKAIDWCKNNLSFAKFGINTLYPPLDYNNETFSFIYAMSVFTHLPEKAQFLWMKELIRILKPGGYILISTHGRNFLNDLRLSERRIFESGKLVTKFEESMGTNLCGAYHPEKFVREELSKGLVIMNFIPNAGKGNRLQDYYLMKKPV